MNLKDIYVSQDELERAFNKVRKELAAMGVLDEGSPLDEVDAYNDYFDIISGIRRIMGYCYENGDIYIPHTFASALVGYKRNVVDVLRHEFGHALADRYQKCFKGVFKEAFGRKYDDKPAEEDVDDWSETYVSDYATTASREDWAETFELYMKHKGKLPARFAKKPVIRKKWNAVKTIVEKVAKTV